MLAWPLELINNEEEEVNAFSENIFYYYDNKCYSILFYMMR